MYFRTTGDTKKTFLIPEICQKRKYRYLKRPELHEMRKEQ